MKSKVKPNADVSKCIPLGLVIFEAKELGM